MLPSTNDYMSHAVKLAIKQSTSLSTDNY